MSDLPQSGLVGHCTLQMFYHMISHGHESFWTYYFCRVTFKQMPLIKIKAFASFTPDFLTLPLLPSFFSLIPVPPSLPPARLIHPLLLCLFCCYFFPFSSSLFPTRMWAWGGVLTRGPSFLIMPFSENTISRLPLAQGSLTMCRN